MSEIRFEMFSLWVCCDVNETRTQGQYWRQFEEKNRGSGEKKITARRRSAGRFIALSHLRVSTCTFTVYQNPYPPPPFLPHFLPLLLLSSLLTCKPSSSHRSPLTYIPILCPIFPLPPSSHLVMNLSPSLFLSLCLSVSLSLTLSMYLPLSLPLFLSLSLSLSLYLSLLQTINPSYGARMPYNERFITDVCC